MMDKMVLDLKSIEKGRFDGVEIEPCVLINSAGDCVKLGDPAGTDFCQTTRDDPNIVIWTIYGHYIPDGNFGGLDSLADYDTELEAEIAAAIVCIYLGLVPYNQN